MWTDSANIEEVKATGFGNRLAPGHKGEEIHESHYPWQLTEDCGPDVCAQLISDLMPLSLHLEHPGSVANLHRAHTSHELGWSSACLLSDLLLAFSCAALITQRLIPAVFSRPASLCLAIGRHCWRVRADRKKREARMLLFISDSVLWGSSFCRTHLPCFQLPSDGPNPWLQENYFSLLSFQTKCGSGYLTAPNLWVISPSPIWLLSPSIVCISIALN